MIGISKILTVFMWRVTDKFDNRIPEFVKKSLKPI